MKSRLVILVATLSVSLLASCMHKKYDTPITKNTQQPDKVLFDQAVKDIEHGKYEVARISLQTLMNTYESSEYLAKAKLAIADSWYREGGPNGLAQAEAEYKDFQLFYPNLEEAPEAQNRICQIHYKQIEKSDRDWTQTLRAEEECRTLLVQYPNSKFAPQTAQLLRNIQESLAEHEFVVGNFYWKREMNPAAANRLNALVDQFPLYSKAGEALYEAGDSYSKMGPRFRKQSGEMFSRIVRDYPLCSRTEDAKKRLGEMELPIPQVNAAAYEHEKFELSNYKKPGMMSRSTAWMKGSPDVSHAAKSGAPTMTDPKPTIPASVPVPANTETASAGTAAGGGGVTDVTATTPGGSSALEKSPDARNSNSTSKAFTANNPANQQALPTNRDKELKKIRQEQAKKQAKQDKKKKKQDENSNQAHQDGAQSQQSQGVATQSTPTPTGTPAASTPANANASTQPPSPNTPQQ